MAGRSPASLHLMKKLSYAVNEAAGSNRSTQVGTRSITENMRQ